MAATLPLSKQLNRIKQKQMQDAVTVARMSVQELGTNVITATPVRDGTAKRNWLYAYGSADTSTTEATDKSGTERIGALDSELSVLNIGDVFYMTNSLPYIERLEYKGWSDQALGGMLRVSIVNWKQIVARNAKRVARGNR